MLYVQKTKLGRKLEEKKTATERKLFGKRNRKRSLQFRLHHGRGAMQHAAHGTLADCDDASTATEEWGLRRDVNWERQD